MLKALYHIWGLRKLAPIFILSALFACKKEPVVLTNEYPGTATPICHDCAYLDGAYKDSFEHPTLSGEKLTNPYSIENMTAAYADAFGTPPAKPLPITHWYVKLSPRDFMQLAALEQVTEDLFDHPLDERLISEGDLIAQPGKGSNALPDLYTVVPVGHIFPPNIPRQVLALMHIPDDDPKWENAALKRSGNLDDGPEFVKPASGAGDLHLRPVEPITDNNGALVDDGTAWAANHPSGRIMVRNELRTLRDGRPVTDAQIVVRRMFKIEHLRTDANGGFACKKYFRNKYTIIVKFRNELARVSRSRPWNIAEQFFPIKINFGKWSNLNKGHVFMIEHPHGSGTIATSQWCAAITHNGVQEHRAMSQAMGIGLPPKGLNILLCSKTGAAHGNSFMLNKMLESGLAPKIVEAIVPSTLSFFSPGAATASIETMEAFKARAADIRYGYGDDPEYLTTDRYGELVYHELAHAAHYAQVGNDWWVQLGASEVLNSGEGFYGDANTRFAPRIALAEGWAYFVGHYMADKQYGSESTTFPEQGSFKKNLDMLIFSSTKEMSSHVTFLESFDPTRPEDPDRWIPKGLFWDLVDGPAEIHPNPHVVDNVSGLKPAELFRIMGPDVQSVLDYKTSLVRWYGKGQKEQIIELMACYGY